MESLRQIGTGILLAVISLAVVLGGFALATAEGHVADIAPATETLLVVIPSNIPTLPVLTNTLQPTASAVATATAVPTATAVSTVTGLPTSSPLPTVTEVPSSTSLPTTSVCLPPAGWVAIVTQPFDTLASLAQTYQMSQSAIKLGNCLTGDQVQPGTRLYVLPKPTATQRLISVPCGAPYGWVSYYVVSGDTLYNIGSRYRVSVGELQRANCMATSTYLQVGKILKVPNVATSVPFITPTTIPIATIPPTDLPTTVPATTEAPPPTVELPATVAPATTVAPSEPPSSGVG